MNASRDEPDRSSIPALSVRQPWAHLIVEGRKRVEVRSWVDPYRGPLWIHAARASDVRAAMHFDLAHVFTGAFVSRVVLLDIVPLDAHRWERWRSAHCVPGPAPANAYGWVLDDARAIEPPVPAAGRLRLFRVDPAVEAILSQRVRER